MKYSFFRLLLLSAFGATLFVASSTKEKDNNYPDEEETMDPGPNPGDLGSVEFTYAGKTVTYTTVRANDGNIWLQQNLGAKRVAQAIDDEQGYGDLFQWGRWADGHQVRTPAPELMPASALGANNNPAGLIALGISAYINEWWSGGGTMDTWTAAKPEDVTATNGCDPCKALGEGWSMPSESDWNNVIQEEDITNAASAFESNLKIPCGGWRETNNLSLSGVGTSSWYWTKDATPVAAANGVWITNLTVYTSYKDDRSYGTSIRCIKKK